MIDFSEKLAFGMIGESMISKWLNKKGWCVLPAYQLEVNQNKGPSLFTEKGNYITPDMFAFAPNNKNALWIEAKHKTVFSWHRISQKWVTGIDIRHYLDYIEVNKMSPWPVWLLFLHTKNRIAKRAEPWPCPTGLFGGLLDNLPNRESHRSNRHGKSGMVYWRHESLIKIANIEDVAPND